MIVTLIAKIIMQNNKKSMKIYRRRDKTKYDKINDFNDLTI